MIRDNPVPYQVAGLLLDQGADFATAAAMRVAASLSANADKIEEIQRGPARDTADLQGPVSCFRGASRKLLVTLAYRLMELARNKTRHSQGSRSLARVTLALYVPIADRLSLGKLRKRLEDACFRILDSHTYEALAKRLATIRAQDDKSLALLIQGVQRLMKNQGIRGEVEGRTKSLFGIHAKMIRTGLDLDEIMDLIGLRIIVPTVPDCYNFLGFLHEHFRAVPGTFDDYIERPKENGYQSLHTCVYPVQSISKKPIEFQIRTRRMHREAEYGAAAHWRYKSQTGAFERSGRFSRWLDPFVKQQESVSDSEAFEGPCGSAGKGDRDRSAAGKTEKRMTPIGAVGCLEKMPAQHVGTAPVTRGRS